jgi:hypothetical protein
MSAADTQLHIHRLQHQQTQLGKELSQLLQDGQTLLNETNLDDFALWWLLKPSWHKHRKQLRAHIERVEQKLAEYDRLASEIYRLKNTPTRAHIDLASSGDLPRTATGRVLTDADFEALADEAEVGYDLERLKKRSEGSG